MQTLVRLNDDAKRRDASKELQQPNRIILASNRGPLEYHLDESGHLDAEGGNGGVATALTALMPMGDFVWVASAMTDGDRMMACGGRHLVQIAEHSCHQRFVALPKRTYQRHYGIFSNPILWFLQHGLWDSLRGRSVEVIRRSWDEGYLPANRAFANAVVEEIKAGATGPYVMIQDYHLYMCPGYVREMVPDVILQHFLHIPWPEPDAWEKLPRDVVEAICKSLLSCDVVGFQTDVSGHNFALTCQRFLKDVALDRSQWTVTRRGRQTSIRTYPVSVDIERLRNQTLSLEFARYRKCLRGLAGKKTIVRVDRLDPSKNILGGLDAFDLLLHRHQDLIGEVKMLAFLVPSRNSIKEFRQHANAVWKRIDQINARFGTDGWQPIQAFAENNYMQALAGMSLYDVLLVNSLADGMNLVSKEGPIVNEREGVVVLSSEVGSYHELREGVLPVAPRDLEATANALWQALMMSEHEKRQRAQQLRAVITRNDLRGWLQRQSNDLSSLAEERTSVGSPKFGKTMVAAG
jgi:trehalose 6-phosphate synthase